MRIAIGADHAGFPLKEDLAGFLREQGHDVLDVGTDGLDAGGLPARSVRPPRARWWPARPTGRSSSAGSGQGEQIAANKVHGIRAALCHDLYLARLSREHNDANVLAMGARVIAPDLRARDRHRLAGDAVRRGTACAADRADRGDRTRGDDTMREYAADWDALKVDRPRGRDAVAGELNRERTNLRLIASENYASPAVLAAVGSTMNNKYAEGYPGRRYYGGCEFVDVTEQLAIDRAKALFGAAARQRAAARRRPGEHGGVRRVPHTGRREREGARDGARPRRPPDPRLAGQRVGHVVQLRGLRGRPRDRAARHGPRARPRQGAPSEDHPVRATPRTRARSTSRRSATIADEVGALLWVDASHFIGLVAGGAYPSPVPYADVVTFTTHKALRGPRGAMILCKEEHAKAIDKAVFPMMQGGPLEHCIAGKAVCLKEAMSEDFKDYATRIVRDARALAAALAGRGDPRRVRRDRLAPHARRRPTGRDRRQARRGGAATRCGSP